MILKAIRQQLARAVLLNTGKPVATSMDLLPSFWESKQAFVRLKNLPVDQWQHEALVVRLEFNKPLEENSGEDTEVQENSRQEML